MVFPQNVSNVLLLAAAILMLIMLRLLVLEAQHCRQSPGCWDDASTIEERVREQRLRHLLSMLDEQNNITWQYPPFAIQKPLFIHPADSDLFHANEHNLRLLNSPPPDELFGMIEIIRNGTVHESYDCGWKTDSVVFLTPAKRSKHTETLCPLLVPQSNSFQHFIDGALPKIIQVRQLLGDVDIKYLVYRPRDRIIEEMIQQVGIKKDQLRYYDSGYHSADYLINTCVTPPVHPVLWNHARELLTGNNNSVPAPPDGSVVLLTRVLKRNPGRNMKNYDKVVELLTNRFGSRLQIFKGRTNLKQSVDLFSNARIIIGVHGGAFYNVIFSRPGTQIVEFIPTTDKGRPVPEGLAHSIVWQMSDMLGLTYWRVSAPPVNSLGDINVDLDKLEQILHQIQ